MGSEHTMRPRGDGLPERTDVLEKHRISTESFNEQFVKQTAEVDGHTFEFVKVEPEEGEAISDQWVVFLGGFGTGHGQYQAEIEDLVRSGRKVFFSNPLKGMDMEEADSNTLREFDVQDTIKNKVAEVLAALETAGIERADIVGHSQGAIVGAILAELRPGLADDLVLNNPAGMHGEDTYSRMIGRTLKGANEQAKNSGIGSMLRSMTKNDMSRNIPYRFTKEVQGIVASNIIPVLKNIKKRQDGLEDTKKTKISLVTANSDRTFAPEKIEKEIGLDAEALGKAEASVSHVQSQAKIKALIKEQGIPEIEKYVERKSEFTSEDVRALFDVVDSYAMYPKKEAGHEESLYGESGLTAQMVNEKFIGTKGGPQFSTEHNAT